MREKEALALNYSQLLNFAKLPFTLGARAALNELFKPLILHLAPTFLFRSLPLPSGLGRASPILGEPTPAFPGYG